jgi:hypothetical protein
MSSSEVTGKVKGAISDPNSNSDLDLIEKQQALIVKLEHHLNVEDI